ncbi:hypothetical protein KP509_07G054100 [Ceratopteris richardii]|uniref:Pectin acetylesterase n=1 Tax=Ceratopteris richardii TaxID=49495 RepID=A0A8T2UB00_CERRI|nr:hypothetical protein KP509_07G054100 [Ceratopteris richardii]
MQTSTKMLLELLVLALMAISCHAQGEAPIGAIELTLVHDAGTKGAVCLDGSLPGYHLDLGSGAGSNSWIVHLEGGAWCSDATSCAFRAGTHLGSSRFMNATVFQGILSSSPRINPYFYNWNRVKVRYCDGGSFSGDAEFPMLGRSPITKEFQILYFRGQRIWEAVMEDLLARGMSDASRALLSGESAGGLASLIHCDSFRELFFEDVEVKCLSDGGIFLDIADINGYLFAQSYFRKVVNLQNIGKNLPRECTVERDNGQSVVDAIGQWAYRGVGTKYVDCPYPCNPTCRSRS